MSKKGMFGKNISFKCCVPTRISLCSNDDLRLSLTTLLNAYANITVCIRRIERELDRRGTPHSFIKALRENAVPDLKQVEEYFQEEVENPAV